MSVNLELYRVFYTIANTGSISKAAKQLFTSQPAISLSLKSLEEKLGGQLFHRTPKGVLLTSDGEFLYKHVEQWYDLMVTTEEKFLELKDMKKGHLRIAVCSAICKYLLMDALEHYIKTYPQIKVSIIDDSSEGILRALEHGKVDLGIININIKHDHILDILQYYHTQDCFVIGPNYLLDPSVEISIRNLVAQHPLMLLQEGGSARAYVNQFLADHQVEYEPFLEFGNADLLIEFSKRNLGVSCVDRRYIQEELHNGELFEVNVKEQMNKRTLGLAVLRNYPLSIASQKFIEFLEP